MHSSHVDAAPSSSSSSLEQPKTSDATRLTAPVATRPSPWGGLSPSPAVRPMRGAALVADHHATTVHRDVWRRGGAALAAAVAAEGAGKTAARVAPASYARHYQPLYRNVVSRHPSSLHTSDSASFSSRPSSGADAAHSRAQRQDVDTTQLITRRYRQLRASWEEWHGVMAAVGPQRLSTLLAQAQQQQQRDGESGDGDDNSAEFGDQSLRSMIHRLYTRVRRAARLTSSSSLSSTGSLTSPNQARRGRDPRGWSRRRGRARALRLRWPHTRVDGVSVLHVQLTRWCREELLPYLLAKSTSLVMGPAASSASLSSGGSSGSAAGAVEDANVELLFSNGSEWREAPLAPSATTTRTDANLPRTSPSSSSSSSSSSLCDVPSDAEDVSLRSGADDNDGDVAAEGLASADPHPSRFTLAWVRGADLTHPASSPSTTSTTKRTRPADASESPRGLVLSVLRRLGLARRVGRRRGKRAAAPRRYRREADETQMSPLDRLVLAQVLQLMPSLWELPLVDREDAAVAMTAVPRLGSDASGFGAQRDAHAPYAPLSDLSRGAASAALDLSLTPTTLATTATTTATTTHESGSGASGRSSDGGVRLSLPASRAAADGRLAQSLAALDACTARHATARAWERHHDGVAPTRADATSAATSVNGDGSFHHAQSALLSVAQDAVNSFPPRRTFQHPGPGVPLPYWQSEHEAFMTRCLQEAVALREQAAAATAEEGEFHGTDDVAHTPYWDRPDEDEPSGLTPPLAATSSSPPQQQLALRQAFDSVTAAFCEAFASTAISRVLDRHHGAADRAASEWSLRHLSALVTEKLAGVARGTSTAVIAGGLPSSPSSSSSSAAKGILACIRDGTPVSLAAVALNDEDERALARVREKANSMDTAVSLETAGYIVTYSQLASLRPRTWLNDQIINNYLQLLCESDTAAHGGREGVVNMGSHFYSKVHSELETLRLSAAAAGPRNSGSTSSRHTTTRDLVLPPLPATNSLLRWLRRRRHILLPYAPSEDSTSASTVVATTTVHTILIPVNLSDQHWALVVARKARPPLNTSSPDTAMSWTFYDSMCPPSGRHPRGRRILHELRHVMAECARHLVQPSLLSEPPTSAPAPAGAAGTTADQAQPARGACRIALPFLPSKNFSLELGEKRSFRSLADLNGEEALVHARRDEQRKRHKAEQLTHSAAADATETAAARQARLRATAEKLVQATAMPLVTLLQPASAAAAPRPPPETPASDAETSDSDLDWTHDEELDNVEVQWFCPGARHVPQQQNGYDCGVFVCQVAWCVVQGVAVSFSQFEDIARMREVMMLELLSKRLLRRLPTTHMSSSMDVNVFKSSTVPHA